MTLLLLLFLLKAGISNDLKILSIKVSDAAILLNF